MCFIFNIQISQILIIITYNVAVLLLFVAVIYYELWDLRGLSATGRPLNNHHRIRLHHARYPFLKFIDDQLMLRCIRKVVSAVNFAIVLIEHFRVDRLCADRNCIHPIIIVQYILRLEKNPIIINNYVDNVTE